MPVQARTAAPAPNPSGRELLPSVTPSLPELAGRFFSTRFLLRIIQVVALLALVPGSPVAGYADVAGAMTVLAVATAGLAIVRAVGPGPPGRR